MVSPIPAGGLEVPLKLKFHCHRYVIHAKMKNSVDLYNYEAELTIAEDDSDNDEVLDNVDANSMENAQEGSSRDSSSHQSEVIDSGSSSSEEEQLPTPKRKRTYVCDFELSSYLITFLWGI